MEGVVVNCINIGDTVLKSLKSSASAIYVSDINVFYYKTMHRTGASLCGAAHNINVIKLISIHALMRH